MQNLSPQEVRARLAAGGVTLLDVRTAEELEMAALPGAVHIPLDQLALRAGEIDRSQPIIVLCHHGVRSEMAGRWLQRNGFAEVAHLSGGIEAWSLEIDPQVPRY